MAGVSDHADPTDTDTEPEPEPEPDTEGPDADHAVPAELVAIYEGMEWERLVALGPNGQS